MNTIQTDLQAAHARVKTFFASAYASSPFWLGLGAGYFGHGVIKAGLDAAISAVKLAVLHL